MTVDTYNRSYDAASNTDFTVTAVIPTEDVVPLFDATDNSSAMTINVGKTN